MKYKRYRRILAAFAAAVMVLISTAAAFAGESGFDMTLSDRGKGSAGLSVTSAESYQDLTVKVSKGDVIYYLGQGKTDGGGRWALEVSLPDGATYDVAINVNGETQSRKLEMKQETPPSPSPSEKIRVSFRLIGDSHHDSPDQHDKYVTWISTKNYRVSKNSPVLEVFKEALGKAGLSYDAEYGYGFPENYISGIESPITGKMLREFDNGKQSGWMYTLNGDHPDVGIAEQKLRDGDRVIFHYIDEKSELKDEPWLSASDADPKPSSGSGSAGGAGTAETGPSLKPEITADKNGAANLVMKDSDMKGIINAAKASGSAIIQIAPVVKGEASKVSVELPKASVDSIRKDTKADLVVKMKIADVRIPGSSLGELAKENGSVVLLTAEKKKDGAVSVEIKVGDKLISKLSGGVTVTLPAKNPSPGTVMLLVSGDGQQVLLSAFFAKDTASARLDGSCTLVIKDNSKSFADMPNTHWAKDAVDFVTARQLFSGTGKEAFGPDDQMTRAMLVKVLWPLAGEPAAAESEKNSFGDVPQEAWYADAVAWAAEKNIVSGTGKGFEPDGNITREQMVTILYHFAKEMKMDMDVKTDGEAVQQFKDAGQTSAWAKESMNWAVSQGLLSGKGNKQLDPTGLATRAEVASILRSFTNKLFQ